MSYSSSLALGLKRFFPNGDALKLDLTVSPVLLQTLKSSFVQLDVISSSSDDIVQTFKTSKYFDQYLQNGVMIEPFTAIYNST